jgi:flagellar hook protein FlgE
MGIFGALTTAISGLRAQSFALEHVSDNIANSQTIGFKRTETSFVEVVSESTPKQQGSGVVIANSRATNTVQGDIQSSDVDTHIAINGDGYFVIEQQAGSSDGQPIFQGVDFYTRRGDFELDRNGYLVNGAGYFLKGLPLDPVTGNPTGSLPQVIQVTRDLIPAQATSQIQYRANLPSFPNTAAYSPLIPNSELLNPAASVTGTTAGLSADAAAVATGTADVSSETDFVANTTISASDTLTVNGNTITFGAGVGEINTAADLLTEIAGFGFSASYNGSGQLQVTGPDVDTSITFGGSAAVLTELGLTTTPWAPTNLLTQGISQNDTLTFQVGGGALQTITFGTGVGEISTLAELSTELDTLTGVAASIDADGNISLLAESATDAIAIDGNTSTYFGLSNTIYSPTFTDLSQFTATQATAFLEGTIAGGAITSFDASGAPVNVQFRWGKIDSVASGGTDTWNMFYLTDSSASGSEVAWLNVGQDYTFGADGQLNPPLTQVTIDDLTVDGLNLGDITLVHGLNGLSQFADNNGAVQVTNISQNGYASGQLASLAITNDGEVTGIYTNGQTVGIAEVTIATFNADGNLRKLDGGAFAATDESGAALLGGGGEIVGQSLEGSNSDIADEFSKLIVTQQAYTANTRIVTTSDEMLQEAVNMVR